ncbi:cyclic-di-AMP receptor [Peptoniphilus raoultii]|uniref:cyclic-di-AMP receptor n=1 Tax=Peptoniphilus raoultii TaxID=1776387 RepID=UPI0008DB3291|nr:cyclic-di-AMP receptor [Peptoniphilus raoultii]
MKLIISIVQDVDSENLIQRLNEEGYRVTKISSTGGFLRAGNTTLLSGVNDEEYEKFMDIMESNSKTRIITKTISPVNIPGQAMIPVPVEVKVGGATIFVMNVVDFKRF